MADVKLTMPLELAEFVNARANLALRSKITDDERAKFRDLVNLTFRAINASPGYFVWIKAGNKVGFSCQIWPTGLQQLNQKPVPVLQKHELTTLELKMSIAQLMELYPYAPTEKSTESKITLASPQAEIHAPHGEGHTTVAGDTGYGTFGHTT